MHQRYGQQSHVDSIQIIKMQLILLLIHIELQSGCGLCNIVCVSLFYLRVLTPFLTFEKLAELFLV